MEELGGDLQTGKAQLNGIRKQSLQGYESNRWYAGVRVENLPGITTLGLFENIQSLMRDKQSVNLSTCKTRSSSCHGEKLEVQKDANTIHKQLRNMLVNSCAVIGLSWGLDQERNGVELTPTIPTDPGTERQKT